MSNQATPLVSIPTDPLDLLTSFGLTRQEAAVYTSLLSEGGLNGYESAKDLGISRSNAYTALASLVDKGAACIAEGKPVRYVPVSPGEFCANHIRRLESYRDVLEKLPEKEDAQGGYVTITGAEHIINRLRTLITGAEERVYLALPGIILQHYVEELRALLSSGKKVVIITDPAAEAAYSLLTVLAGARLYAGDVAPQQIRAIADSRFVLTGELSGGKNAGCLFSDRKNLVDIFKTALRNEIRLIEMGSSMAAEKPDELF